MAGWLWRYVFLFSVALVWCGRSADGLLDELVDGLLTGLAKGLDSTSLDWTAWLGWGCIAPDGTELDWVLG